jgi:hypothetical protein
MTFNQFYTISLLFREIEQLEADYNKAMSEVILSGATINVAKERNMWFRKMTGLKLNVISEYNGILVDELYSKKVDKIKEMLTNVTSEIANVKPLLAHELDLDGKKFIFAPGAFGKALDELGIREYVESVNSAELVESLEIIRLLEDKELGNDMKYTLAIMSICLMYRPANYEEKTFDVENYLRSNYKHFNTISAENGMAAYNFFFYS